MLDDVSTSTTRLTLLSRLRRDSDDRAWQEFVGRYGPKIHSWCRKWGLQEADAQDVTQTVLLSLAAKMRSFRYNPGGSFRNWLRTIARHAWIDFVTDRQKASVGTGDSAVFHVLQTVEAREDLEVRLAEGFDLELLQLASIRVRERVEPHTWEAFRLTALEGLSGAEVASKLSMPVLSVFKAKSNVQKMLQAELARMEQVGDE
jgi:RNA polymerase sigma-70 factor (ECF subfamily)